MMSRMLVLFFSEDEEHIYQQTINIINKNLKFEYGNVLESMQNIKLGRFKIDLAKRIVIIDSKEILLTNKEFEILYLLAQSPGRVFSREQIYDIVWQEPYSGDYNIVMSHIRNIREKIEDDPSKPLYIQTVWGVGYRFNKNLSSGL